MIVVDRKAPWIQELAWLVALLAELGHERAAIIIITREYLHSMIAKISDEQETSMMVEHQAMRIVELAISIALLLGADRELDSSITIKSIVSHLFLFNLSLNDKEMIQAPNCSNQGDEDMKLSLTRDTRETPSKQATSNKKQQEPIDEGTKNSTSLPHQPLPHTSLFVLMMHDGSPALPIDIEREALRSLRTPTPTKPQSNESIEIESKIRDCIRSFSKREVL